MAQLQQAFDPNAVAPITGEGQELSPSGWYPAIMTKSELKPTGGGTGTMLVCDFEITDGPCKGRKYIDRLNIVNSNEMAVTIAYGTLSNICRSAGYLQVVTDTSVLHNLPLKIKLKLEGADSQYNAKNELASYKAMSEVTPEPSLEVIMPPGTYKTKEEFNEANQASLPAAGFQAAPQQTAPAFQTPQQTAPQQTAPQQTAPQQTAPQQTAPQQTAPAQQPWNQPQEATQQTPQQTPQEATAPAFQAAPQQAAPQQAAPQQAAPSWQTPT